MIKNIVVFSDTHCGCSMALCPPRITLDEGGRYTLSGLQKKLWKFWQIFWDEFVPEATKGEEFVVVINGDAINGVPHLTKSNISDNFSTQIKIAEKCFDYAFKNNKVSRKIFIRGTFAHVGKSAEYEEILAKSIGADVDSQGNHSRYEAWIRMGKENLIHFTHHIAATSSQAFESSAPHRELIENYLESGRWRQEPANCVVRSHRHRYIETCMPTGYQGKDGKYNTGKAISITTPCWQGKPGYLFKYSAGRLSLPQFGACVIRISDDGTLYTIPKVWTVDRSPAISI